MKIFAAIDLETTGLNPASNEVLEIAIVPLNPDFTISTDIPEFSCRVRAEHPERIEQQAMGVNGLDPNEGESLAEVQYALMEWAAENEIESITPLAHNLAFDMSFMKAAFPDFSRIFSHHGRDSMRLAYILNDVLRARGAEEMFSSGSLKSVKTVLDIEGEVQHHALEDARDAAHAYRKMIAMLDMA